MSMSRNERNEKEKGLSIFLLSMNNSENWKNDSAIVNPFSHQSQILSSLSSAYAHRYHSLEWKQYGPRAVWSGSIVFAKVHMDICSKRKKQMTFSGQKG